ncbi:hypothetical protein [Paraburkholderia bannensis]|uniref:hypothetical protein n=1 Tax=Paraburkholderia bannensis TaxID=765414 RepID=UPI002AB6E197|nr:hypothetical protein [Paraburkholderia bannensis]
MNERNAALVAIEGSLAPLFSVVSKSGKGAGAISTNFTSRIAESPFELASLIRSGDMLAVFGEADGVRWGWGFPGWQAAESAKVFHGFEGRTGISKDFLELAGFERDEIPDELTLLERLGDVGFVVRDAR